MPGRRGPQHGRLRKPPPGHQPAPRSTRAPRSAPARGTGGRPGRCGTAGVAPALWISALPFRAGPTAAQNSETQGDLRTPTACRPGLLRAEEVDLVDAEL